VLVEEAAGLAGFGVAGKPAFWIAHQDELGGCARVHVAFVARDQRSVWRFHEAAISAGGVDVGPAGSAPFRSSDWFAESVLDPDGNCIEAVAAPEP